MKSFNLNILYNNKRMTIVNNIREILIIYVFFFFLSAHLYEMRKNSINLNKLMIRYWRLKNNIGKPWRC